MLGRLPKHHVNSDEQARGLEKMCIDLNDDSETSSVSSDEDAPLVLRNKGIHFVWVSL